MRGIVRGKGTGVNLGARRVGEGAASPTIST
jgi:hypothetical protein